MALNMRPSRSCGFAGMKTKQKRFLKSGIKKRDAQILTSTVVHSGSSAGIIAPAQSGFFSRMLSFAYAEIRINSRRLMNLVLAVVPLMMLLVGSCKTSELPNAYGGNNDVSELRMALFPDRPQVAVKGGDAYTPAAGYLKRARKFVEGEPQVLSSLTQQEVTYLFGEPSMERRDANARVWQYKNDGCVVDFYFYEKGGATAAPVSYVDYRLGGRDPAAASQQGGCLKKIASQTSVIASFFS